jgi:hypothetical protein
VTEDATSRGLPTTMGFAAKQAIDALRRRNVATADVPASPSARAGVRRERPKTTCPARSIEDERAGLIVNRP